MDIAAKISGLKIYVDESVKELKKVAWPPRKDTIRASYAVVAFVVVVSFFLAFVDYILAKLINWLVG